MNAKIRHDGEGHRGRLRDKFLTSGLSGFHDYEVIELLLTLATPRKDCKGAAKAALARFKSFQGVLEASPEELCRVDGVGPKNILGIKLIKAVADRYLKTRLFARPVINNSQALVDYLALHLGRKARECFCVIFLDAKNRVIDLDVLFSGTLTASSVYPREVVQSALTKQAAAVIFAHNHPSGDPTPSDDDLAVTRTLLFACHVVGVTVHEHVIIGHGRHFSFADHGVIRRLLREYRDQQRRLVAGDRAEREIHRE